MSNSVTSETSQENKKKTKKTVAEWESMKSTVVDLIPSEGITSLNVMGNGGVFSTITKEERTKYLYPSKEDSKLFLDKKFEREFKTSEGYHVILNGPMLCQDDATILSMVIRIYLDSGYADGKVKFSYREIARRMKVPTLSGNKVALLKRSLGRLYDETIKIYKDGTPLWVDRPITELRYVSKGRSSYVELRLSCDLVDAYIKREFSIQAISKIRSMPQLEQFFYRTVTVQTQNQTTLDMSDLWERTRVARVANTWDQLEKEQKESERKKVKRALNGLIRKNILSKNSYFQKDIILLEIGPHKI